MNEVNHDLIDGSIVSTPKPSASSTVEKKHLIRNIAKKYESVPLNCSIISDVSSHESLGILDDVDLAPQWERSRENKTIDVNRSARLKQQRALAQSTLNKVNKLVGLPSRFLTPSESYTYATESNFKSESTVSESDLLKRTKNISEVKNSSCFNPNDMSTPRSSNVTGQERPTSLSLYENITQMSEKIRNSDVSLKDICAQHGKFSLASLSRPQEISEESGSELFMSGELATEKLRQDELAWRKEQDIPVDNSRKDSMFSACVNSTAYDEKFSVGDFFQRKSEEVTDTFFKTSPERKDPVPLIDVTNIMCDVPEEALDASYASSVIASEIQNDSLVSISQIAKVLASANSQDTPTKVVNYLLKKMPVTKSKGYDKSKRHDDNNYCLSNSCLIPQKENSSGIKENRNDSSTRKSSSFRRSLERNSQSELATFSELGSEVGIVCGNTYHETQSLRNCKQKVNTDSEPYGRHSEDALRSQSKTSNKNLQRQENFECGLEKCGKDSENDFMLQMQATGKKYKDNKNLHERKMFNKPASDIQTLAETFTGLSKQKPNSSKESGQEKTVKIISKSNKENLSPTLDRSVTSTRSGSSLDTLPDGKFPIKSTRTELAWGCLKLGRSNTQEFFIRNQLNQRIRLQASVTGSAFRILKDRADSDVLTSMTFMLHPMETKSFYVAFCPTKFGSCSEKLNFYPIINGEVQYNKRQILVLYGYGGHTSLDIMNVPKDSSGKLWLSLGKLDHRTMLMQKFTVRNNGALCAFACLDICSKGLYAFSVLYVQPNELILKPQEEVIVTITYTPAKQDFRNLINSEVAEIGCLKIVSGAEPLRGRLRRLCTKLKQTGGSVDPLLERLSKHFPHEKMPSDLKMFKETVGVTKELLQQLTFKEVTITLEQDLEHTLVGHMNMDETSMYHTLGPDVPNCSAMEDVTIRRVNGCQFKVEPTSVILTPPMKIHDTILLHSESVRPMTFEVAAEPRSVFYTQDTEGIINPGETVLIRLSCRPSSVTGRDLGKVSIYVENEVIEVSVKCVMVKQS